MHNNATNLSLLGLLAIGNSLVYAGYGDGRSRAVKVSS